MNVKENLFAILQVCHLSTTAVMFVNDVWQWVIHNCRQLVISLLYDMRRKTRMQLHCSSQPQSYSVCWADVRLWLLLQRRLMSSGGLAIRPTRLQPKKPANVRGPGFFNAKIDPPKTSAILQCLCFLRNAVRIRLVIIFVRSSLTTIQWQWHGVTLWSINSQEN